MFHPLDIKPFQAAFADQVPQPARKKPSVRLTDGNIFFILRDARETMVTTYGEKGTFLIYNEAKRHDNRHFWCTLARYARLYLDVQAGTWQWQEHLDLVAGFYDSAAEAAA